MFKGVQARRTRRRRPRRPMRLAPALGLVVSAVLAVWAASGARAADPGDPPGSAAVRRLDPIMRHEPSPTNACGRTRALKGGWEADGRQVGDSTG